MPYFEFSNFYTRRIVIDDVPWDSTEHYYQAHKFLDIEVQEFIRGQLSPGDAARAGRSEGFPLRSDWGQVKELVMFEALCAKFTQHDDLKRLLLGTGDQILVEASSKDSYWGWGWDRMGKNRLGYLLMDLRKLIRLG